VGFVKKAFKEIARPFESVGKELGRFGDSMIEGISGDISPDMPEIDTSAQEAALKAQTQAIKSQEAAAKKAAEESRRAADQSARNARWQAEGAAQQFASQQQREQLQQAAVEESGNDFLREDADIQVGSSDLPDRAKRRKQFTSSGTSSSSPSIRI